MTAEKGLPGPDRVATAVALAQAEFEAASLHRQLRFERWVSIAAVLAAAFLGILACPGS